MNTKRRIVADSSADLLQLPGADFAAAPLKIVTEEKEYVDDGALDVHGMVKELAAYKGRSGSSCPNPEDWLCCFGDAQEVFCITITAALSGSYSAACVARDMYLQRHPERKVFVLNSLSTGPEMRLLAERLRLLCAQELSFEKICEKLTACSRKTGLLFMLESMKNLANNGRVNPLAARAAGLLGIRVIGKASERGELELLGRHRGAGKVLSAMSECLKNEGYRGGRLRIAHCFHEEAARKLAELVRADYPAADVMIYPCRGLCSFYAEEGGLLVGFEKE